MANHRRERAAAAAAQERRGTLSFTEEETGALFGTLALEVIEFEDEIFAGRTLDPEQAFTYRHLVAAFEKLCAVAGLDPVALRADMRDAVEEG